MKVNQERGLVSNELPSETWGKSLWFIVLWTVLLAPFWIMAAHMPVCGIESRMLDRDMLLHNEFLYGAGQVISMAGVTLGLAFSVFLRRKRWPFAAVFLGGIAATILSLIVGTAVTMSVFHVVQPSEIVRLEEYDYRQPTPSSLTELDKKEYLRGYDEGWREYASRWYSKFFPGGKYAAHEEEVQWRKDNSPFQRGFGDGQSEAAEVADNKVMRKVLAGSAYQSAIRTGHNPTRAYTFKYLDVKALEKESKETAFAVLQEALRRECMGELGHRGGNFCLQVCEAMLRLYGIRGRDELMRIYRDSTGREIKGVIVSVLGNANATELVPEIIAGLKSETNVYALDKTNYALAKLTGHKACPDKNEGYLTWQELHAYWKAKVDEP